MPFLDKDPKNENKEPVVPNDEMKFKGGANFNLKPDYPIIQSGIERITQLYEENTVVPKKILEEYKIFEPIMNQSRNVIVKDLFKPKKPVEDIRERLAYY